ncbi:MAG: hypothetical protein JO075_00655, partial [Acidimicrobiia bacterium]|nr:hypothetical protein [Acidimicrobiia bacterium]
RTGRKLAYAQLSRDEVLGNYPKESGDEEYQQCDSPPGWANFPDEDLDQTPRPPREKLRDALVERAKSLIDNVTFTGWRLPDAAIREGVREAIGNLAYYRLNSLFKL